MILFALFAAWHVRLRPYYDTPAAAPAQVPVSEPAELGVSVKHESGSGSEKENEARPAEKKRKVRASSSDSEPGNLDPDFEPNNPPKSTKPEVKKEFKEHSDKRREKEKKKKKDKDRDRDRDRDKERSRDDKHKSEKHRDRDRERHGHHHQAKRPEKTEKTDSSKLSFKVVEPQSFEKLITESAAAVVTNGGGGGSAKKCEKVSASDERRNMSQLFPGQLKADSVKKKLALTPQTSPKLPSHGSMVKASPLHKPSEPAAKKPSEHTSPVKKVLNFDNPSKNVNILDQIMSNMSFPANKE